MPFIDIEKDIDFNDNILNCQITKINEQEINISNVEIKFQKNRTIIFTIYSNENILRSNILKIKGKYFNYNFYSTIAESADNNFSILNNEYVFIIDLIEFAKDDDFFINSNKKYNINIISSKNFSDYIKEELNRKNNTNRKHLGKILSSKDINQINFVKDGDFIRSKNINSLSFDSYIIDDYVVKIQILNKDKELANLFNFLDIKYEEYNSKIKYIMELYTLVFDTPILIEKVKINENILYQTQSLNIKLFEEVNKKNTLFRNNHFTVNLSTYLDLFIDFKKSNNVMNKLFKHYFITEVYDGKTSYNLNDISGFIDLFEGLYFSLNGTLENKEFICSECSKKYKTKKKIKFLNEKIDYVIKTLEPCLIDCKIDIDKDEEVSKTLSNFRNMVRHPEKDYKNFDLNKIMVFSEALLKLYIIRHILKIDSTEYNLYRILSDFGVYPLVKHIYKYFDKEIIIYNTQLEKDFFNKTLTENTTYFLTLKEYDEFKNSSPEDFIYDNGNAEELKRIYIDKEDKVRSSLLYSGIITFNNKIFKSDKYHKFNGTYEDFITNLDLN